MKGADIHESFWKAFDDAERLLMSIEFSGEPIVATYMQSLLVTLIEHGEAIVTLLWKDLSAAVPSVFRTYLEACIDILNLSRVPDYWKRLDASFYLEKKRFLESVHRSGMDNVLLRPFVDAGGVTEALAEWTAKLEELKKEKHNPLKIKEKFELAGALSHYEAIYSDLSLQSHNNRWALSDRHVEETPDGEYQIALHKTVPFAELAKYYAWTAGILEECLTVATNSAGTFEMKYVVAMRESLGIVREIVQASS